MSTPNDDAMRNLYEVTRKVPDINWVLVDRNEYRHLVAENEAHANWKTKIIKAAEEAHGPAAFRFKLSLRKSGTATNQFPQWLDGRWVSFVYAENDAHIGLHAKIEAQRELLRQAVESLEVFGKNYGTGEPWASVSALIAAINEHLKEQP